MTDPTPPGTSEAPNEARAETARQGPLKGLRVIEMAAIGPVPLCGQLLADLGADVILVDRLGPSALGLGIERRFDLNLRGRRSVGIDIRHVDGREALLRLLQQADVLLEGFRPGVMERLGLSPAECHAVNPRLVFGRMTGFGQTGPLAEAAGHDLNYIALSGALHAIGPSGGGPLPPLNLVGDYGGGSLYLALGVLSALFERQASGRGQVVDAAMVDGAASLMSVFFGLQAAGRWSTHRGDNLLDGGSPFYACYRTADGLWLSVAPLEPKFFACFVALSGLDQAWIARQYQREHWPALREAIAARMAERTRAQWVECFAGSDACVAPVLTMDEAATHPQALERRAFVEVAGIVQPAPAPRFDRTASGVPGVPPQPGEHTEAVLAEAGYSAGERAALRARGVVA